MEPSLLSGQVHPHHLHLNHQHHRLHHAPLCHRHIHCHHFHQVCPQHNHHHHFCCFHLHIPAQFQNPRPVTSHNAFQGSLNLVNNEESSDINSQVLEEAENEGFEEEDDEDLVFVLTDEWRDFFAASEAKRKLERQQAKRKGKK